MRVLEQIRLYNRQRVLLQARVREGLTVTPAPTEAELLLDQAEQEIQKLQTALLGLAKARLDWDGVSSEDELALEACKCVQLEPAARAAYRAACTVSPAGPEEPDWGRGGYKTQVLYWRAVARACAEAWGLVAFEERDGGKD